MRARHVLVAAAAAVGMLAGCSSAETPAQVAANATTNQPPAQPACADVFQPGKTVNKANAQAGCLSPSGTVHATGGMDCTDGTLLWQVDATTGAPAGYAREGKPYTVVKGDIAADKGYKKAYEACIG